MKNRPKPIKISHRLVDEILPKRLNVALFIATLKHNPSLNVAGKNTAGSGKEMNISIGHMS